MSGQLVTARQARGAVVDARDLHPHTLIIDLGGVVLLDSAGLCGVTSPADAGRRHGVNVVLLAPGEHALVGQPSQLDRSGGRAPGVPARTAAGDLLLTASAADARGRSVTTDRSRAVTRRDGVSTATCEA